MFNLSREVACPECHGSNFWKGDPRPTDRLHCRYCKAFVAIYDEYIHGLVRNEAARMLARFIGSDSEQDLDMLKYVLSQPERRGISLG